MKYVILIRRISPSFDLQFRITFFFLMLPVFGVSQTPLPPLEPLYIDSEVPRIDILLPEDSLAIILAPGNESSNYHFHATMVFTTSTFSDTLDNVGFRLRGNTSRFAAKKSFKVSFNTYVPGREYFGVEKLNLNGEHNDPSVIRSKLSWDLFREIGIPAPRSNHVELYINDNYFGLYISVEHIDEEFVANRFGSNNGNLYKCLWPADLNYLGDDPSLYKFEVGSRRTYDLKTNTDEDDYSDLAHFIFVLNQIADDPTFVCELEKIFNVEAYLKVIAMDILIANWDGPIINKNNFYLYQNTQTGKFEYIPYDLDNTFGIDWFQVDWGILNIYNWAANAEHRPIYSRIMAVTEYRNQVSYHMNQMLVNQFNTTTFFSRIDSLKLMIDPFAFADNYRTLDYGFSVSDFNDSYITNLPPFHVTYGLKPYITTRSNSSMSQLLVNDIIPIVTDVTHNFPGLNESVVFTAKIEDEAIANVQLFFSTDGIGFQPFSMNDGGINGDVQAGDGIFGVTIPGLPTPEEISYFIQATDNMVQTERKPACDYYTFSIGDQIPTIRINEFMAANNSTDADEAGDFDDWIEIFNFGPSPVYLGDKFLTDDLNLPNRWQMPDMYIYPDQYLLFWADDEGFQGDRHTNFKLNKDGEQIGIFNGFSSGFSVIDTITYGPQADDMATGRLPNGTGPFQVMVIPTPGAANSGVVSIHDPSINEIIEDFSVVPNPFSEVINVNFSLRKRADVNWVISDVLGQVVFENTLAQAEGEVSFSWHPTNRKVSTGIYYLTIITSDITGDSSKIITKKLIYVN